MDPCVSMLVKKKRRGLLIGEQLPVRAGHLPLLIPPTFLFIDLSMLSLLRAARSHRSIRPLPHIRHFAEEVTSRAIIDPSASSPSSSDDPNVQASPPALRDQESKISIPRDVPFVKVDDRHGLWHFFREFWNADQKEWQRTTVEFKNQDGVSGK